MPDQDPQSAMQPSQRKDELVLSYHRVRNALGFLGIVLPFVLILGGLLTQGRIEPSISDFFHTALRDVFVGSLCAIGVFLISYRGYRKSDGEWLSDDLIATVAGIAAFGVAFFPNETPDQKVETLTQLALGTSISPMFHYASASIFFFCLMLFCYVKFPKTAKPVRRRIYRWCGHVIALSLVGIVVSSYFKINGGPVMQALVVDWRVVFWVEAAGIWAFAISWLVKGKADMMLARTKPRAAAG